MEDNGVKELSSGATIGPYVIVRPLGAGAFGAVYEARKAPLDKRIALKVLHADKAQSAGVYARFVQEAQAAASLKHPHIVDVDDVGVIESVPYLAMEFLDGEPLSSLLKREGALTPAKALDILLPVFSAAAAVHARGIVHRDLKPDNLFLWKPVPGQVHPKLLDFGIAKVREGEGAALTRTGAIMGTPLYMSPEQWGGSKYATAQSDQWALGVILYQCLSGQLPFEADELPALMMRVSMHPPMPLRASAPGVSEALERAVMRAIEKDPACRHASVRDFGKALLPFANVATRARWSTEFVGEGESHGSVVTLGAPDDPGARMTPTPRGPLMSTVAEVPTPFPHTLNASVRSLEQIAPTVSRPRRGLVALGALGAFGLVALGFVASQVLGSSRVAPTPAAAVQPMVAPRLAPTTAQAPSTTPQPSRTPQAIAAPAVHAPVVTPAPALAPPAVTAPGRSETAADAGVAPTPHRRRRRRREGGGLMI